VAEVARDPATAGRLLVDIMNEPDNFSLRCALGPLRPFLLLWLDRTLQLGCCRRKQLSWW
jgi:hypothetical protein